MEFLIFPDSVTGAAIAGAATDNAEVQVISHASGRPWIVGRWSTGQIVHARTGRSQVAIIGCTTITAEITAEITAVRDLDALARTLPGSFHLIASVDGLVRAQGSLSTLCQIFHTSVRGTTVAADRPQSLAPLAGTDIVEDLLAPRLLAPWPPWPLNESCLWRGVEPLALGHYLELDRDGRARTVRWWTPPEPALPLREGAERVRSALQEAVAARARPGETVSADLSGGMDSTSLCFLAARSAGRLVTTRWRAADPADEDGIWAQKAAAELPDAEHLVLSRQDAPVWFAGITEPDPDVEAPFAWIRTRARLAYLARQVADRGSATHVTGHGGDELFLTTPLYLHALARTAPIRAISYIRANRAIYRWKTGATVRALLNDSSFGQWLRASTASLTAPVREFSGRPEFGWGISHRMPPWATGEAVDAVRSRLLRIAASEPEPLAALRGQHAVLQDVWLCGDTLRRVNRLTSRHGVSWQAPFVDDRVVEAALSIRFDDCAMPDRYKPALAAAMRTVVPDFVLGRSTKSDYSAEAYEGLRRHRTELLELCDDMRLVRRGLVDADALRSILLNPPPSAMPLMPLISTFATEAWLRSISARPPAAVTSGESR